MAELLAPAGAFEGLKGAVQAGADAVYVGGRLFGARAYAKNFSDGELTEAIDYVHLHGKKLYLTVNTLLKNLELERSLYGCLAPLYERGLDGVIVQDLGVLRWIREQFPDLPLHASTQMTVTGAEGMRFLESLGASRVVAARELSLRELKEMHEAGGAEIEAFVHGALCYSYSGQCLFSSLLGGRSGNRGRCAQPCRLPYQLLDEKKRNLSAGKECPLSPKDLCTMDLLPQILEAGVYSLKIEGRMKQPGYTAGVVEIYRKYLDLWQENPSQYQVEEADRKALAALFHRGGFTKGYYLQHNGPEMMAFSNEKKIGGTYPEITEKKETVDGVLRLFVGHPAVLMLSFGAHRVTTEIGEVQEAKNQPMTKERIRQQIEKTGDTDFVFGTLQIETDDAVFVPVRVLNELRRTAFEALERELLARHLRKHVPERTSCRQAKAQRPKEEPLRLYVSCETAQQAREALLFPEVTGLYLPLSLAEEFLEACREKKKELYAALPHIVRAADTKAWEPLFSKLCTQGLTGFLVRNLESCAFLKRLGLQRRTVLDSSVYTWNESSLRLWEAEGVLRNTAPLELNAGELAHRTNKDSEMVVYGRLPLMVSAQCLQKNTAGCKKNFGTFRLQDRCRKEFPVRCYCDSCYNVIYNSLPLGLSGEAEQVKALGFAAVRLAFTVEERAETKRVLAEFAGCYFRGARAAKAEYTKGHLKRGVE